VTGPVADPPIEAEDTCYRHPGRQSYVLCQRCGRTICPECQIQAAVGVHCPECAREGRRTVRSARPSWVSSLRNPGRNGAPVVTYSLIGISVVVFLLQFATGGQNGAVTDLLRYQPVTTFSEPWRLVTSMFSHANVFHILFNMYALYLFGSQLEGLLGRARYLALYLLSGLGGSAAVLALAPNSSVVGASGAIFGLFAAYFVVVRHLGGNAAQVLVLIALNLVLGFFVPAISWQAHVGGAVAGALTALVLVSTRSRRRFPLQIAGLVGVLAVIVAVLVGFFVYYSR
jgi:membrane associated rhomboid family serine protease